mgnify:CR=1 FL=1
MLGHYESKSAISENYLLSTIVHNRLISNFTHLFEELTSRKIGHFLFSMILYTTQNEKVDICRALNYSEQKFGVREIDKGIQHLS